jgi:enoyl-[acyl-carrier protein] reductase II
VIRTRFTELFAIEAPVVQAPIWPATSPELIAAVGDAGAIGSVGALFGTAESVTAEVARIRELTDRPFIVNHVVPQLDEDAFEATLAAKPAAVSFALGDPGKLVERVHAAGAKAIQQVHTVEQARAAVALGVDAIVAQGSDAGGQGMVAAAGTLTLVPQVVDVAGAIPVLAAGGVADGRGLAAALAAGADGANVGTRFLASDEASAAPGWKQAIVEGESEAAVRLEQWADLFPIEGAGNYPVVPRVLRTDWVDRLRADPEAALRRGDDLRADVIGAVRSGDPSGLVPFTGQTAGLIHEVLPAAEIVKRMVAEAEAAAGRLGDAIAQPGDPAT